MDGCPCHVFSARRKYFSPAQRVPFSPLPCPAMTEVVQNNIQALARASSTTSKKLTILAKTRTSTKTKRCSSQKTERKGIQKIFWIKHYIIQTSHKIISELYFNEYTQSLPIEIKTGHKTHNNLLNLTAHSGNSELDRTHTFPCFPHAWVRNYSTHCQERKQEENDTPLESRQLLPFL